MTVILKWVDSSTFKEIHKIHPKEKIIIDYAYPETASIDVILVPGDLCFTAKLDLAERPNLQKEIENLSLVDDSTVKKEKP